MHTLSVIVSSLFFIVAGTEVCLPCCARRSPAPRSRRTVVAKTQTTNTVSSILSIANIVPYRLTPEQRLAVLSGKERATDLYSRAASSTSSFAVSNGLDYVAVRRSLIQACRPEISVRKQGNVRTGSLYALNGIKPGLIDTVSNDVDRISREMNQEN